VCSALPSVLDAVCLERGADLHMDQRIPLPLTVSCFSKSRLVLPFWYRLTWVVPDKGPLNGCECVICVYNMYIKKCAAEFIIIFAVALFY